MECPLAPGSLRSQGYAGSGVTSEGRAAGASSQPEEKASRKVPRGLPRSLANRPRGSQRGLKESIRALQEAMPHCVLCLVHCLPLQAKETTTVMCTPAKPVDGSEFTGPCSAFPPFPSLGLPATGMAGQKGGPTTELGSLGSNTLPQRRLGPGGHRAGEKTAGGNWGVPSHAGHFTGVSPSHQELSLSIRGRLVEGMPHGCTQGEGTCTRGMLGSSGPP